MSSDSGFQPVSVTIIDTSDYASVFGTTTPTSPPTASLLRSFTTSDLIEFVYGVMFTDSTNAPFVTTFTLSYNKSSTYSHSSQSGEHSSYSTNVATDTLDATQSSPPSILSSESSSSSGSVPATASATADQTPKNDTTVSSGAAAGIAIACAVFGAILAAAIVGVFLRRRYQHAADRSHRSEPQISLEPWEKSRTLPKLAPLIPQSTPLHAGSFDALLPPPIQDRTIVGDFSKLGTSIKNHAQSFYSAHDTPTSSITDTSATSRIAALLECHPQVGYSEIAALLHNPDTRTTGVRVALISAIVKGLDPGCEIERTLLPPGFAQCMASFKTSRSQIERKQKHPCF